MKVCGICKVMSSCVHVCAAVQHTYMIGGRNAFDTPQVKGEHMLRLTKLKSAVSVQKESGHTYHSDLQNDTTIRLKQEI
jgi:hypothetical protein